MPEQPLKHGEQHHPEGPDPARLPYFWPFKVFADDVVLSTGDGKLIWFIPKDMVGRDAGDSEIEYWRLIDCEAAVTTVGGSATQVQVRNVTQGHDMLSTKISIDSGEKNSKDAATQPVVNAGNALVEWGDHIAFDVDAAGSGAKGLVVYLWFDFV